METFRRFEKKYLLNDAQYRKLLEKITPYVKKDRYFASDISSIYYDTDNYRLIRRSVEKPEYKEKLRVRSYGEADDEDEVFVEVKKKFDGVVYKRRTKAQCKDVLEDIYNTSFEDQQVGREIRYALDYYGKLSPKIYIGSTRTSYYAADDKDLRITFDRDIRYRLNDLSLKKDRNDRKLTADTVMELKVKEAMPLWLTEILDECGVYPTGFSKVGSALAEALKGG